MPCRASACGTNIPRRAAVAGDDHGLAAEFAGLPGLALADALHFGGMPGIDFGQGRTLQRLPDDDAPGQGDRRTGFRAPHLPQPTARYHGWPAPAGPSGDGSGGSTACTVWSVHSARS